MGFRSLVMTVVLSAAGGAALAQAVGGPKGYAERQTFSGRAFFKDSSVWAYSQNFARLFGMPEVADSQILGAEAAAFRIEEAPYTDCGLAGDPAYCRKVQLCFLDIYFDESKVSLPWATERQMEYVDLYGSLRWLQPATGPAFKRYPLSAEPPQNVIQNRALGGMVVAFADPDTHRAALFLSNHNLSDGLRGTSGALGLLGFTRRFYQDLSVVKLQTSCMHASRRTVDIWLAAPINVIDEAPRLVSLSLKEGFVRAVNAKLEAVAEQTRELLERVKRR